MRVLTDPKGQIWYDLDAERPVNSHLNAEEFAVSEIAMSARRVRVLGVPRNAALIAQLYMATQSGPLRQMQIGSPTVCHPYSLLDLTAEHVLRQMRLLNWAPSCGGWHDAREIDAITYTVAAIPDAQLKASGIESSLRRHPVAKVLEFLGVEDLTIIANLVRSILDPRWYVDRTQPNSPNRLYSYMGLDDANMKKIFSNTTSSSRHEARARLVVSSWLDGLPQPLPHGWEGWPNYFAWRQYTSLGSDPRAALRTSQRVLRLIADVWLQAAVPYRELFVPKYFFSTMNEARAWQNHMSAESSKL